MQCVISDFGMSRTLDVNEEAQTRNKIGPLKWWAPESLLKGVYSPASDMWSYGIVAIECFTRDEPYPNELPSAVAAKVASMKNNNFIYTSSNAPICLNLVFL